MIEFTRKIKDGSEHQGDDHLQCVPITQDAPPNPDGHGNKRLEVRLKPSLKQGGQACINPGPAKQDVAQHHSATASKGCQIPLQNGKGMDSQSGKRQLAVSGGDGMMEDISKSPWVHWAPAQMDADVPSPPSKGNEIIDSVQAATVMSGGIPHPCYAGPQSFHFDTHTFVGTHAIAICSHGWVLNIDIWSGNGFQQVKLFSIHPLWQTKFPTEYTSIPEFIFGKLKPGGRTLHNLQAPQKEGSKGRNHLTADEPCSTPPLPPDDDIPPPPPPPDNLENVTKESDEDETDNALIPPPPPPPDDPGMINDPIPPPPPSLQESDSHHSVASLDGNDTSMDMDTSSELPPQPPSDEIYTPIFHLDGTGHNLSNEEKGKWRCIVLYIQELIMPEAERSLSQIADLDDFYNPFTAIGPQWFAEQPQYLAQQSVMDMIIMYMGCCIDTAIWHLYCNLCIDMSTLDCRIPIVVMQNCYQLPFPTLYMLHHMGGWTEETFHNALFQVPEVQMSDTCLNVMELLLQWTPHLQEDGGIVLPWWLMATSNYASDSHILCSNEVQTIAQRYFRDFWPLDKSPIKDHLHGTLELWVESYKNNACRVEALLPDLNAQVEELFEWLTCMAQMLGLYTNGARHELCTCVESI
ncbi:hypothetical protein F5J12DRAFT_789079 [Pisolithus orientalis]|uniref:uncharacterized protein n=1 Tax=Pisolithus orientalis TaxID=936130 RepID=UPI0022258BC9|nr:uncharacterized protein F5J12DRAFT_789079 [Pisolithus orientalis]KAI5980637.1 hypothetical protein F5J12DRAFT_789079 [Pisolithus orientalis]